MRKLIAAICVPALLLLAASGQMLAADLNLEAQLIWASNDAKSPDPKHKPASPEVERKLKTLPFKWENYYEVNRQRLSVAQGEQKREQMSKQCTVQVKNLGGARVEVQLVGKGAVVEKRTQALPKGELLVIGGNAENNTAWFVVLKQAE